MPTAFPSYAIIPAAGISNRMGRPKLLLPYRGQTVIENVLDAWQASQVRQIVIVVRPNDDLLISLVTNRIQRVGVGHRLRLIVPKLPPNEMKHSVQIALGEIQIADRPPPESVWLLAPADMPQLSVHTIDRVLSAFNPKTPKLIQGHYQGKRAHPVLFPWGCRQEVDALGENEGINAIVRRHEVHVVSLDTNDGLVDIDTPDDYDKLGP